MSHEGVVCVFKNPFADGFVKVKLDDNLTVSQLHETERMARKFSAVLLGSETTEIPPEFKDIPINSVGRMAIKLLRCTIPEGFANTAMLVGITAASLFYEQLFDRVNTDFMIPRLDFQNKLLEFVDKYGQPFIDAVSLQLDNVSSKPKDFLKPDDGDKMSARASRLVKLCDLVRKVFSNLSEIMGTERFDKLKTKKYAGGKIQKGITIGKNGMVIKKLDMGAPSSDDDDDDNSDSESIEEEDDESTSDSSSNDTSSSQSNSDDS